MTPTDFRLARRRLRLTGADLAKALGLADGRTVRRLEAGDNPVSGPVSTLLRLWLDPRLPAELRPGPSAYYADE